MVGQKNLLDKINIFNLDTFPRSSLLIAEKGMGKHTVVQHIKENILKIPLLDITKNISNEIIDQYTEILILIFILLIYQT